MAGNAASNWVPSCASRKRRRVIESKNPAIRDHNLNEGGKTVFLEKGENRDWPNSIAARI